MYRRSERAVERLRTTMKTAGWISLLLWSFATCIPDGRAQGLPFDGPSYTASWSFNDPLGWCSDQSSLPLVSTNLGVSTLADGTAVMLDASNCVAQLCYAIVDGTQTNVATDNGTISLWVASSSWASTNVAGGMGTVQSAVPLFEVGGCVSGTSGGGFGLFLDESGCWLSIRARASDGSEQHASRHPSRSRPMFFTA